MKGGPKDQHGVDLLIGGHDHIYYVSKFGSSYDAR